jgi:hypothetical protein
MKQKRAPNTPAGPLTLHRAAQRTKAAARHLRPEAVMSTARAALMDRTPYKHLKTFTQAVADFHEDPDVFLQQTGHFARVGRSPFIAQYAGGAYVQHLPKSKGHRKPAHRAALPF